MKNLLVIATLVLFTSCVNPVQKKGYSFELSDYKLVKKGISSKDTVIGFMGSPTFISDIGDQELWIYFSEDVSKVLFFKPKILDRKIMTISFDDTHIVDQIEHYSLDDERHVKFSSNHTQVKSHKKGFLSQIFSNIGQISAN